VASNVTSVNFTGTAQTFTISGTISPVTGGAGTTVTLSGAGKATTTTGNSGTYSFSGLPNGTYTITPSHAGFAFTPTSQNATISGANITGLNFSAKAQAAPTFTISGTVAPTRAAMVQQ